MTAGIPFTIEGFSPEEIQDLLDRAGAATPRAIKYIATEVWAQIGKTPPTPADHGRLAGSFAIEQQNDLAWRIYTNVEYALQVHEGTGIYGPHGQEIVPVHAKALVFFWKRLGKKVAMKGDLPNAYAKRRFAEWAEERGMTPIFAWPKGQPGRPYATWAMEAAEKRTDEFIARALRETTEGGGAA